MSRRNGAAFVAALGVDDLLLVERLGLVPAGVVLGYSLHSGILDPGRAGADGEDGGRTRALVAGWTLCRDRLLAQAEDLGADGVVGIDLRLDPADGNRVAVRAHGTAVRARTLEGGWRTDATAPFTTTLSGRDVWLLARAGYRPLGIAFGASAGPLPDDGRADDDGEHDPPAQALYDARERALDRVRAEADALAADGVVGLAVTDAPPRNRLREVGVVAWGTSVRRIDDHEPGPDPEVVLPLTGGSW